MSSQNSAWRLLNGWSRAFHLPFLSDGAMFPILSSLVFSLSSNLEEKILPS